MRRDDTGEEYTRSCDVALLEARKIGKGPVKVGDRFRCVSRLDDSEYTETLIRIGKTGIAKGTRTWIVRSDGMGVSPRQIKEAMAADERLGCKIEYDAKTGQAIFRSPKQYAKYAQSHGFFDRNGGYSSAQSLNDEERQRRGLPMLAHADDGSFLEYD